MRASPTKKRRKRILPQFRAKNRKNTRRYLQIMCKEMNSLFWDFRAGVMFIMRIHKRIPPLLYGQLEFGREAIIGHVSARLCMKKGQRFVSGIKFVLSCSRMFNIMFSEPETDVDDLRTELGRTNALN